MAINNTITAHRVPAMTVVIIRWQTRSCPDARSHLNGQFSFAVFSVVGLMVGFYLRVRVRIPQALIDAMSNDQTGQCYLPLNEGKSYCLRRHEASSATTGRYCRFHQEFSSGPTHCGAPKLVEERSALCILETPTTGFKLMSLLSFFPNFSL